MKPIIAVLVMALALSACSEWFFFPDRAHRQKPDRLGLAYRDIHLTAEDDTRLHAWFLPAAGNVKGTVLFLHGNAENISTHIYNVYWLPAEGYQVLLLDYRGFGQSEGLPEFPGVFLDIDAAIAWLNDTPETANAGFYLLGQSIGAALALYAASQHIDNGRLCGLVSDAAFASYGEISRHVARQSWLTWPFQYPVFWAMSNGFDPVEAAAKLDSLPILFFHSRDDRIIPFANFDQLVSAHKGFHRRVATTGPHTATFNDRENRKILLNFLSNHGCYKSNG